MQYFALLAIISSLAATLASPIAEAAEPGAITWKNDDTAAEVATLTKRRNVSVKVYQDKNYGGRYQNLATTLQKCYPFANGWDNQVSSLHAPTNANCYFYLNGECSSKYLYVPARNNIPDLKAWGVNDQFSSYRCS